jgi:phosphohistidine phosphatase SixA
MLVGHMPHLARLLHALRSDRAHEPRDFPLHGCVGLDAEGNAWKELWRLAPPAG